MVEMALGAHGDGARAQAARLEATRCLERLLVCAGLTGRPSRPLKFLQSGSQSVPSPVACHSCSDDGYGLIVAPKICLSLRDPYKLRLTRYQASARACRSSSL